VRPAALGAGAPRQPVPVFARSKPGAVSNPVSLNRFFGRATLYLESERAIRPTFRERIPGIVERANWLRYQSNTALPAHPDACRIEGLEASWELILPEPQTHAGRTAVMHRREPWEARPKSSRNEVRFVASVASRLEIAHPSLILTVEQAAASIFDPVAGLPPVSATRDQAISLSYSALAAPVTTPFTVSLQAAGSLPESTTAMGYSLNLSDLPTTSEPMPWSLETGCRPLVATISVPWVPSATGAAFSCELATSASMNLTETAGHIRAGRGIRWPAFDEAPFRESASFRASGQIAPYILPDILHPPPSPLAASAPAIGYLPGLVELRPVLGEVTPLTAPLPQDHAVELLAMAGGADLKAFAMFRTAVWTGEISKLNLGLPCAEIDRSAAGLVPETPAVFRRRVQAFQERPTPSAPTIAPSKSELWRTLTAPEPADRTTSALETESQPLGPKMPPAIAALAEISAPSLTKYDMKAAAIRPAPESPEMLLFRSPTRLSFVTLEAPGAGTAFLSEVLLPTRPPVPADHAASPLASESVATTFPTKPAMSGNIRIDSPRLSESAIYRSTLGQPPGSPEFRKVWSHSQGFELPAAVAASDIGPLPSRAVRPLPLPVPADRGAEPGQAFGVKDFEKVPAFTWSGGIGGASLGRFDLNRAAVGQLPDSPAAMKFRKHRPSGFMPPFVAVNPGPAKFAGFALHPAAPAASEGPNIALLRTRSLFISPRRGLSRSRHLRVEAPLSGFAPVGPRPVVENALLLQLGENLIRPKRGSTPAVRLGWLKASMPALRRSADTVPLSYRFRRNRKPWDGVARWAKPRMRALPRVAPPRWRFLLTEHDWSHGTRYQ
jgi:hypothetical protein